MQVRARFEIRKLLARKQITGHYARALRLYAATDKSCWRTYDQVGDIMHLSKERVRQLLRPSKNLVAEILGDHIPWRPVTGGGNSMPRPYRRRTVSKK